jgi:hypothetical protein
MLRRADVRASLDEAAAALSLAEDGRSPTSTPRPTPPSSAGSAARLWSAAGSARGFSASSSDDVASGARAARAVSRADAHAADARHRALVASLVATAAGLDEEDDEGDSVASGSTVVAAIGSLVYIFSHGVNEPHAPEDVVALEIFSTAEKAREFLRWTILERRSDVDYARALKSARTRASGNAAVRSPPRARTGQTNSSASAAMRARLDDARANVGDTVALKALMSGVLGAEARYFDLGTGELWERPLCTELWDDVGQGRVSFLEGGHNGEFMETYRIEVKEIF